MMRKRRAKKIKPLKLHIAKLLAAGYLCIFLALLIGIAISNDPVHSDGFLAALVIAMPWSYWLVDTLFKNLWNQHATATFFILMFLCALLNTVVVYWFGLLVSRVASSLTRLFSKK